MRLAETALALDARPEADQRRLLRRLRRGLEPGDLLLLGAARPRAGLLRQAGFALERPGVARALPMPPEALAVASWRTPPGVPLDLRYANDEAGLLEPSPAELWDEIVRAGAGAVGVYAVDDPYGGERGTPVVAEFFGCPLSPQQVTFGAGVTSLLHALAGLADGGTIVAPELVHPDLEAWALAFGSETRLAGGSLIEAIEDARPALVHFDRPDFAGRLMPLEEVQAVADAAARAGAITAIDESPAPYFGPAASAARLVGESEALVVVRGFTKAYSWGGLRGGFAVSSQGVAARVRELVPPLLIGELALAAALRLLGAGDVFARLRARIRAVKPEVSALVRTLGSDLVEGHPDSPWVAFADPGGTASEGLARRGVRALLPARAPAFPGPSTELARLTVPLSDERLALFRELVA